MLNRNYGIGSSALAVQAYIEGYDGIEASWDHSRVMYRAEPKVAPWYNGRERGVVFYMLDESYSGQINIAIYEHRNSDHICALMWRQNTTPNPPSLYTLPEDVLRTKYDYSMDWSYNQAHEVAEWVIDQLNLFWKESAKVVDSAAESL